MPKLKVFLSYAQDDVKHLERLIDEIDRLGGSRLFDWLFDVKIQAGEGIHSRIQGWIKESDAWILLLSKSFVESNYCCDVELPQILVQNDIGAPDGCLLLPVAVGGHEEAAKEEHLKKVRLVTGAAHRMIKSVQFDQPILDGGSEAEIGERFQSAANELIKILRPIAVKKCKLPPSKLEDLRSEMLRGEFTPFLGSSCSDVQENYEKALPHLRSRLNQLLESLGDPVDRGAKDFAISVAKSRRLSRDGNPDSLNESERPPNGFLEMQVAIARSGAAACEVFGAAFSLDHQGFTDARNYSVVLDEGDERVKSLRKALSAAVVAAKTVADESPGCLRDEQDIPCLGISGIWTKLAALVSVLFEEVPSPPPEGGPVMRAEPSHVRLRGEHHPTAPKKKMMLSQLEWLGDLLWHTMRFDAPLLPSPEDLSFQFSLCSTARHCLVRAPLGLTTAAHDYRDYGKCCELILRHFARLKQGVGGMPEAPETPKPTLARGIATMLKKAMEAPASSPSTPAPRASAAAATEDLLRQRSQPMVLTSNLDHDIEDGLQKNVDRFYVLFPISHSPREGNSEDAARRPWNPGWMLAACARGASTRCYYVDPTVDLPRMAAVLWQEAGRQGMPSHGCLPGPLVVRLRGAPLVAHPGDRGDFGQILQIERGSPFKLGGATEFKHRILLSYLDFSRELVGLGPLPQFLLKLMGQNRVLCFLGHVLDEPDSLFGLNTDVWLKRDKAEQATSVRESNQKPLNADTRVSIDCHSYDEILNVMLEGMGVVPLDEALEGVGGVLLRILGEEKG